MRAALYGHGVCRCGRGPEAVATWALEEELEYWDRALAETAAGLGQGDDERDTLLRETGRFLLGWRAEVARELERRRAFTYTPAPHRFRLGPVVDEVKRRADLLAVVGCRTPVVRSNSRHALFLCPFHHEKSASFVVFRESNTWHCFGCGQGGDVIAAAMKLGNQPFVPAVLELAREFGIDVPERQRRKGAVVT